MNKRTYFTNQRCPKCGNLLRTSDLPQYSFVCPSCDENFYGIELEEKPELPFDVVPCSFATNKGCRILGSLSYIYLLGEQVSINK